MLNPALQLEVKAKPSHSRTCTLSTTLCCLCLQEQWPGSWFWRFGDRSVNKRFGCHIPGLCWLPASVSSTLQQDHPSPLPVPRLKQYLCPCWYQHVNVHYVISQSLQPCPGVPGLRSDALFPCHPLWTPASPQLDFRLDPCSEWPLT